MKTKQNQSQYFLHLDGLRGIAALVVVISHLAGAFYPAILFDENKQIHTQFDHIISNTPLSLFFSGRLSVNIFFILSGFVLSHQHFISYSQRSIYISITKRYIRLVIPVLFSTLIIFSLLQNNLIFNKEASEITKSLPWFHDFWSFNPSLESAILDGVFISFIISSKLYNPAVWTIHYEFTGSLIVFLFMLLLSKSKYRYIAYAILSLFTINSEYILFIIGVILSDIESHNQGEYISTPLTIILLSIGIYLGTYPDYHKNIEGTIYALLKPLPDLLPSKIGATLIFFTTLRSPLLQNILTKPTFRFLGNISFSLYLIHFSIIASLTSYLFINFILHYSYHISFILALVCSIPAITLASWLFYNTVDKLSIRTATLFGNIVVRTLESIYLYIRNTIQLRNSQRRQ